MISKYQMVNRVFFCFVQVALILAEWLVLSFKAEGEIFKRILLHVP